MMNLDLPLGRGVAVVSMTNMGLRRGQEETVTRRGRDRHGATVVRILPTPMTLMMNG